MSNAQTISAGVVLLTVIGIAHGGRVLLRVVSHRARQRPSTLLLPSCGPRS
ncbi:hypothetical protein HJ590_12195 [Naumannella sp. ID2617S]|nr:hypothetical protein [Naumannella sp. ID2617S]